MNVEKRVSFFCMVCYALDMENPSAAIISTIYDQKPGWVFTPQVFASLADPRTIGVVLGRLVQKGTIRRLARGLYDYPKNHPELGELLPSAESVAKVIAQRDHIRLQPSGAYAANLLGLSEQVPAKVVFLTDGKSRSLKLGKLTIELKKASPRFMALAGKDSGVVIQALRHLGKEHIGDREKIRLKEVLKHKTKKELLERIEIAPAWMRSILKEIADN